ncbi:MAG: TetR/AcrR family transcriptional regulator [Deltaproteobacteria bacterium]|nr:TetR/AcrR family transcriptional regulator [Kofleriaceae bacterium]
MARPATDIRHRIVVAARDAFDHGGVDAVSLRTIARKAKTTIGMIYYYFPTKDELFLAVIEDVYEVVLPEIAAILSADLPLRPKLGRVMARLAGGNDAERAVMRIAVRDALVSSARRTRLFERFQRGHIPLVLQAIVRAEQAGELRADVPAVMKVFSAGAVAVLGSLVLQYLPLPGLPPPAERAELALDLLFDGIAASRAPRTSPATAARAATGPARPAAPRRRSTPSPSAASRGARGRPRRA